MADEGPFALVLADDAASADALSMLLRDWGAEVVEAGSRPDEPRMRRAKWVVADLDLGARPGGLELARALLDAAPLARGLMLSGAFAESAAKVASAAGFLVLNKPVCPDRIRAWLAAG